MRRWLSVARGFLVALSAIVLAGRFGGRRELVTPGWDAVPVAFVTAMIFLASGIALLAPGAGRRALRLDGRRVRAALAEIETGAS